MSIYFHDISRTTTASAKNPTRFYPYTLTIVTRECMLAQTYPSHYPRERILLLLIVGEGSWHEGLREPAEDAFIHLLA